MRRNRQRRGRMRLQSIQRQTLYDFHRTSVRKTHTSMLLIQLWFPLAFSIAVITPAAAAHAQESAGQQGAQAHETPPSADLRPLFAKYDLPNRRQGSRGTCSVFAVTGALEFALAVKQGHGTRLSVEFLNWASHKAANRTADGGFFSELWTGYKKSGICAEEDLPYSSHYDAALVPSPEAVHHARTTPGLELHWIKEWNPHTGLAESQHAEIKSTIARGWPVMGGFRWPKRAHWRDGVLQMCPPEDVFDGHSVLLVGYREDTAQPGGGVFIIRNSGGDGSDGYLPYAFAAQYMNDAAYIKIEAVDSIPVKSPQKP